MRVLIIGDVVGQLGCDFIRQVLVKYKKENNIDVVIANGENSAEGNGILPHSANHLFDSGVDIITAGNHALRRREIYDMLNDKIGLIRPANFNSEAPGCGYYIYETSKFRLCVINLQGTVYMDSIQNPFDCIDNLLKQIDTKNIIVDFHAEATSEKLAMGYYLDGRVSLVYGTHTHVQTADERIMPNGTGYITDIGMCGGYDSILGVKPELVIKKFKTNLPVRFENARENCHLCGIVVEIDKNLCKTTKIVRINLY